MEIKRYKDAFAMVYSVIVWSEIIFGVPFMQQVFIAVREEIQRMPFFKRKRRLKELAALEEEYYACRFNLPMYPWDTQIDTEKVIFGGSSEIMFEWNIDKILNSITIIPHNDQILDMDKIQEKLGANEFVQLINSVKGPTRTPQEPILLMYLNPTGTYYVLDGKHRLRTAYCKRLRKVPVRLVNSDDLRSFWLWPEYDRLYVWLGNWMVFLRANGMS